MVNEQFDAASDACLPADQSIAFEVEHHLMDGRSRDGEKTLMSCSAGARPFIKL